MKKPETTESLIDVLEGTLKGPKDYEGFVSDGAAIDRLQHSDDFRRYQRLLAEAYLQLIERMRLADPATLPALQGALIQHSNIMHLPAKVVQNAVRMVETQRAERERADVR